MRRISAPSFRLWLAAARLRPNAALYAPAHKPARPALRLYAGGFCAFAAKRRLCTLPCAESGARVRRPLLPLKHAAFMPLAFLHLCARSARVSGADRFVGFSHSKRRAAARVPTRLYGLFAP